MGIWMYNTSVHLLQHDKRWSMSAVSLIVQVFIFMMLSIMPISCFCFFVLCEIHITLSVLFSSIWHSCFAPFFFFFPCHADTLRYIALFLQRPIATTCPCSCYGGCNGMLGTWTVSTKFDRYLDLLSKGKENVKHRACWWPT